MTMFVMTSLLFHLLATGMETAGYYCYYCRVYVGGIVCRKMSQNCNLTFTPLIDFLSIGIVLKPIVNA